MGLKVLIIGYGSMGKRRARLLKKLEPGVTVICVDPNPERQEQAIGHGFRLYGRGGKRPYAG